MQPLATLPPQEMMQALCKALHKAPDNREDCPLTSPLAEAMYFDDMKLLAALHEVQAHQRQPLDRDLVAQSFGAEMAEALIALTKKPGEDYEAYLARVKENPLAAAVKAQKLRLILKPCAQDTTEKAECPLINARYQPALAFVTGDDNLELG